MDFVTLGMFIIDDIHFQSQRPSETNVLGGAGSWAVLGARLFRPPPSSKRIGWTVHRGSDWIESLQDEIDLWSTECNFVDTPERLTTRGWNRYGDDDRRAFKYLTEKLRIDHTQLTPSMLAARCFHLICTPTRCINLVQGILDARRNVEANLSAPGDSPIFIWEPVPDSCEANELENVFDALKYVDVVSPNHQELAALFTGSAVASTGHDPMSEMREQCEKLLTKGFGAKQAAVVLRCGERGCFVYTKDGSTLLPAYYQSPTTGDPSEICKERYSKVVDTTGAGNAFLGGFSIGLLEDPPPGLTAFDNAAIYGSIAASFAVEQVGLPKLTDGDSNPEKWNGESVLERLISFRSRLAASSNST